MGDILEQYAIDAGEIEEVTPFEDEVSLTEAVNYESFDRTLSSVTSLGAITESLESLTTRFIEAAGETNWDVETCRQYENGVNAVFSANGFTLSKATLGYSTESNDTSLLSRGKDLLARLWEAFKEGLAKFIDICINLINSWGKTRATVMKMAEVLRERAKAKQPSGSRSNFQGSPSWSSYLHQDTVVLSGQRALKITGELIKELGTTWINVYDKLGREISSGIYAGEVIDQAWLAGRKVVFRQGTAPWPGGYNISLTDGATVLDQSISVTRKPMPVDRPPVLNIGEVIMVTQALDDVADDMGDVELALKRGVADLKTLRKSIDHNKAKIGPQILSKSIRQMVAGPRILLPITGSICQNAFRHANASLQI